VNDVPARQLPSLGCSSPANLGFSSVETGQQSFLARNEFLIRRLHSLSGLIPVGAYMVIHLLVNSTVLESPGQFQQRVYDIHSFGSLLPILEWGFIFTPILFHAIVGVVIIQGGLSNYSNYQYGSNARYSMQRITGMIAFFFILWHVFHMHGIIHADWWVQNVANPLNGALFYPFSAASSAGQAMQVNIVIPILYIVGVTASVFHLANGIWTMGITWGVWTRPAAQRRALYACGVFGLLLGFVGLSSVWGMWTVDVEQAKAVEEKMFDAKVEAGVVPEDSHKRAAAHDLEADHKESETATLSDEQ
jgi:succinate dehydrogenase / fumarate reductase cytochrome b subunit